jgi:thiol-disulfide isomerase/thioredoxin
MKSWFNFLSLFVSTIEIASCQLVDSQKIIIRGTISKNIKNVEGQKLYLFDKLNQGAPRDSTIIKNHTFLFEFDVNRDFTPFRAALMYKDTVKDQQILDAYKVKTITYFHPIGFQNPFLANTVESNFYVDEGEIIIVPLPSINERIPTHKIISSSRQNEPFYKHLHITDPGNDRDSAMTLNLSVISQYRFSYYLLHELFRNKVSFTNTELKELLNCFDENVKKSVSYNEFRYYLDYQINSDSYNKQRIDLEDQNGNTYSITDSTADLTLLVFWASWCRPCRAEIPELKKIQSKYPQQHLSLSSISIDEDKARWQEALKKENMPWRQFIVTQQRKLEIDAKFNIREIPTIFLINKEKTIIKKFSGVNDELYTIIDSLLSKRK